jgi:hypothetical protein
MKSANRDCCEHETHYCKTDIHKNPAVFTGAFETSLKVPIVQISPHDLILVTLDPGKTFQLRKTGRAQKFVSSIFIFNRVLRI